MSIAVTWEINIREDPSQFWEEKRWVSMAVLGLGFLSRDMGQGRRERDCGSAVVWVECRTEGKAKGLQNWWGCKGSKDTAQIVWKLPAHPGSRTHWKWLELWLVSAWESLPRSSALEGGKNQAEPWHCSSGAGISEGDRIKRALPRWENCYVVSYRSREGKGPDGNWSGGEWSRRQMAVIGLALSLGPEALSRATWKAEVRLAVLIPKVRGLLLWGYGYLHRKRLQPHA